MKRIFVTLATTAFAGALLVGQPASAGQDDNAERACQSKIKGVYGVSEFRNMWTETLGNHKFRVHGQVKTHGHKYDFNCKVKNGNVKSYAYDGPHNRHGDNDNDSNVGTAIAVGAGLAIIAAVAVSQADGDNDRNKSSTPPVSKTVLEDECHDMLQYRIRDEHNYTAQVQMKEARLQGYTMTGDAKVKYDRSHPHHATFTCHFDNRGRLKDTAYRLY